MSSFSKRIFMLLVISSLILGLVTYRVTINVQEVLAQNALINRSDMVLLTVSDTVSQVRSVQGLAQSYLLTGESIYLSKYRTLYETTLATATEMPALIAGDPQQHNRAQALSLLLRDRLAALDEVLAIREQKDSAAANARYAQLTDQRSMERGLALITQIQAAEQEWLTNYHHVISEKQLETLFISGAGVVACVTIFLFLFWLIDREGIRRERTEQSLQGMVGQMEQMGNEMRQLGQLSDYLQSCREMEEIYNLVHHHIATLLPHTYGFFGMFNNSRNVIELVAHWGAGYTVEENKYFMPEDCWALRRGALHFVSAKAGDPCCNHSPPVAESICIPMVAHGETLGMIYLASPVAGSLDAHTQQLARSVSEQVSMAVANMKLEKTLRMQSVRDPLTQLFNRRYMETSLEREILRAKRKNEPVSVIMIDVDHFKRFNDTCGHDAGDAVLKEFSKLALKTIRAEDIACRYGGEEFILILPGATTAIAENRANKMREEMAAMELNHNGKALGQVTISLGIASYPEHSELQNQLIKKADDALYKSKHDGRNRVTIAAS